MKQEHVASFRKAVLQQAATSLESEPACRRFDVCMDSNDSSRIFLYELYDDRQAFDLHLKTAHFHWFNQTVSPWVADKQVRLLEVISLLTELNSSITETP